MTGSDSEIACFGPFRLSAARRELERDGMPVALGPRALDLLIVLVERVWRDDAEGMARSAA